MADGRRYRCALVIRVEDRVDDHLLAEIGETTGLEFELYGSGGFGGETLADAYTADGTLLMEVLCDEVGVKALFVWSDTAERAAAIRDVIGARLEAWSEQVLRAQLMTDTLERAPEALVALMMAGGGASPDPETLELLQRALSHDDHNVRVAAEYAQLVASELVHPPLVLRDEQESELQEILRPTRPVVGEPNWVTARAGVPERVIPRPVTWLKAGHDTPDKVGVWAYEADWNLLVAADRDHADWFEFIYCPMDERTALHVVRHPALGEVHLALHGEAVEATAALLVEKLGSEVLDGPPENWDRTRADTLNRRPVPPGQ
ncbi:hypothetical protein ILP97_17470 [Amycolatopsis sp. H6(2020)]|nr:hypothetical protein [Amycolatopsis sp. H6(2020)]